MSIFSRIFKIGQATINKFVDGLEDPEKMLDQAVRDKQKQIRDAKKSIQECIASERQTKALLEKEKNEKLIWEQKAEAALKAGREELAVKALSRATEHEQKAKSLTVNWEQQRQSVESLKSDIQRLEDELADFKRNKDFIVAQSKASEVKKQIYEAKARISKKDTSDDLMARLKSRAERNTYEAQAAEEMAETFEGGDSLEKEFTEIGDSGVSADVQNKLDALKAKMGRATA